jgi:hypothetical protein
LAKIKIPAAREQRIIARLSDALDVEDLPSLPKWILKTVERGEVEKAIRLVDYLNETDGSPWKGKILMANSDSDDATLNQRSFVKAIVKYVLTANNRTIDVHLNCGDSIIDGVYRKHHQSYLRKKNMSRESTHYDVAFNHAQMKAAWPELSFKLDDGDGA